MLPHSIVNRYQCCVTLVKTLHVHSHVQTSVPHTINSIKMHVISLPVKAEGSDRAGIAALANLADQGCESAEFQV